MRRRLYFLLPDVDAAKQTANDLLLARVNDRDMHFLARRGTDLGELREASTLQKTDLVHGAEVGLVAGGIVGIVLGFFAVFNPPGLSLQLVTVLLTGLGGALFGAWVGSLVGASVPNSRLRQFRAEIDAGHVLMMVDLPLSRIDEVRDLVHRRHPEASGGSVEPTMPAFP